MTEIILGEPAEDYHARPAVSAGLLWDIVKPKGCLAKARHNSRWLNPEYKEKHNGDLDFGTVVHLAALEPEKLQSSVALYLGDNWRTNEAQSFAHEARVRGKVPLLKHRTPRSAKTGYTYDEVLAVREALQTSDAASLLFGAEGQSEVTFLWDLGGLPCKARADRTRTDRVSPAVLIDLKTAESGSKDAFRRAIVNDGHHLRAAWYLSGYISPDHQPADKYIFVVVEKSEPYLVTMYELSARTLAWGDKLWKRAVVMLLEAQASDTWRGYGDKGELITTVDMPGFAEWDLADLERAGEL